MLLFTLPGDLTVQKLKGLIQRLFKIDFSDQVLSYVSQKVMYMCRSMCIHYLFMCYCHLCCCLCVIVRGLIFVTLLFVVLPFLYGCLYGSCENVCGVVVCSLVAVDDIVVICTICGIVVVCVFVALLMFVALLSFVFCLWHCCTRSMSIREPVLLKVLCL